MSKEANIAKTDNWFVGEDRTFIFTVNNAADSGAENITGWALEWVLRKDADATAAIITKTVAGGGITIPVGTDGKANVLVLDDDTVNLEPGTYYHTLRRTDGGQETVLSFGTATLRRGSTR
ncbi:MAG: hypothetical protein ACRD2A_13320 [Vicinamibacterales bacterium]